MFSVLHLAAGPWILAAAPIATADSTPLLDPAHPVEPRQTTQAQQTPAATRFSISTYYSEVEFAEWEFEDSTTTVTVLNVERERIGVQFGFGNGYARLYSEEIGDFRGFGLGVGVQGPYAFAGAREEPQFLLDYDASLDLGLLDESDFAGAELTYISFEGKFGPGVGFESFHASAGLNGSFVFGTVEAGGFEDADLDGQNVGFYASLGYLPGELPLRARLDLQFGDIDGIAITIGYAF